MKQEKTAANKKAYAFFKRAFDVIASFTGLLIFSPIILGAAIAAGISAKSSCFFRQERFGKNGRLFRIVKIRTMRNVDGSAITVKNDSRITKVGKVLRKTKIDELPQLVNVLKGDMSFVGWRPEVPRYRELFTGRFSPVLTVKPGITGLASLMFKNENEILGEETESVYIDKILPAKLSLELKYLEKRSFFYDLYLIIRTVVPVFRSDL